MGLKQPLLNLGNPTATVCLNHVRYRHMEELLFLLREKARAVCYAELQWKNSLVELYFAFSVTNYLIHLFPMASEQFSHGTLVYLAYNLRVTVLS